MKVLIALECSGITREAFAAKGHNAVSCDLQASEIKGRHRKEDIRAGILDERWDLIIAHPVCKRLANSGVRWLHERPEYWKDFEQAVIFFNWLKRKAQKCKYSCIENPVQHLYARLAIEKYTQIIHPWQFGHTTKKTTCLWLKGLPPLQPTKIIPASKRTPDVHYEPPGVNREKNRSRSFEGIAKAMAEQWNF